MKNCLKTHETATKVTLNLNFINQSKNHKWFNSSPNIKLPYKIKFHNISQNNNQFLRPPCLTVHKHIIWYMRFLASNLKHINNSFFCDMIIARGITKQVVIELAIVKNHNALSVWLHETSSKKFYIEFRMKKNTWKGGGTKNWRVKKKRTLKICIIPRKLQYSWCISLFTKQNTF